MGLRRGMRAPVLANAAAHRRTPGLRRGRAGSSGSSCWRRGAPLGAWIWPAATAHRRTPGAPAAGARVLPDQAAGDADLRRAPVLANAAAHRRTPGLRRGRAGSSGAGCWPHGAPLGASLLANAAAHRRTPGLRRRGMRVLPDPAAGDADLRRAPVLANAAAHQRTPGAFPAACGFFRSLLPAMRISVGPLCWPMLQLIVGRRGSAAGARVLPEPAAGHTELHRVPGCWPMLQLIVTRRGSAGAACGFFRSRLPATRTPLGSWIWPAATAHRQRPGAPAAGARVLPDPAAGDADLRWVPGFGHLLRLIVRRQALPPRARGSSGSSFRRHKFPPGFLGAARCCSSPTGAPPRRAGSVRDPAQAMRSTGCLIRPTAAAHRHTPGLRRRRAGSSGSSCWRRRSPSGPCVGQCCSSSSDARRSRRGRAGSSGSSCWRRRSPSGSWVWPAAELIGTPGAPRHGMRVLPNPAAGNADLRWLLGVANCCSSSSDAGAPPRARGFFRSRLLATRSSTGCLVVGQCCSSSSDARRSRRGRAGSSGSSCWRRRSPSGPCVGQCCSSSSDADHSPARHADSAGSRLQATSSSTGLLDLASC